MKKNLLKALFLTFFLPVGFIVNAQSGSLFYPVEGNDLWLEVNETFNLSASDLARNYISELGLSTKDELILEKTQEDEMGILHYRFRQYHKGIKVEGAILLMHEKNGRVFLVNGKWIRGLNANTGASLGEEDALAAALNNYPAETYMWESEEAERMLKRVMRDPNATAYPKPEMVLIDPALNQEAGSYKLAYGMEIHTLFPSEQRKQVFIDATTGALLLSMEKMHTQDSVGVAETKYSGTQEITADFIEADSFRLRETGRGGGIETYNFQTNNDTTLSVGIDFFDHDNFWSNFNAQQDEAATDAHWGAEMTFDFFDQILGHSGLDGEDMPLISAVHIRENYVNAFWNGRASYFGDGNGTTFSSLATLDVVAHEFTHGVTEFSAGLIYAFESGALNESFSDIFGTAIEIWATPELGDWLIAEDCNLTGNGFRNMSNPKEDGQPDTYRRINWNSGPFEMNDFGGVHTNSGVQNYWFYLLSEGGSGTNDNNDDYTVNGLGIDTATHIAFRNLKYYLTERSVYEDARLGAIQAAEDLYGFCSEAVQETMKAWYAVGVGVEKTDFDVRLLEILTPDTLTCGLTTDSDDAIILKMSYYGCNADLQAGDKIPMAFQVNYGEIIWDTLTLESLLTPGDTLIFTYNQFPEELTTSGYHNLKCWAALEGDLVDENNAIEMIVDNVPNQNVDLTVIDLISPKSDCFLSEGQVEVEIAFRGCDALPAGESIDVSYQLNDGTVVMETITTPMLSRSESFRHTMSGTVDLSAYGRSFMNAWVDYEPDYLLGNDTLSDVMVTNPYLIFNETTIGFEGDDTLLDSVYWATEENASVWISEDAARDGNYGLQMSGANAVRIFEEELEAPDIENVWNVNQNSNARFCFCLDLTNQVDARMSFDRRQTYSTWYSDQFGNGLEYASPLRVLINETQVGPTFRPTNPNLPIWYPRTINLQDYLGQLTEVCFETRALLNPQFDPIGVGDNTFLDNIVISGLTVATTEPLKEITGFEIFPNPGSGQVTLDFQSERALDLEINVMDAQGRLVQSFQRESIMGQNLIPLNLHQLSPGMYFVQLMNSERHQVKKLIIE